MEGLSSAILREFPPKTRDFIMNSWQGGSLVCMPDELSRACEKDIEKNQYWVFPVLRMYPSSAARQHDPTVLMEVLLDFRLAEMRFQAGSFWRIRFCRWTGIATGSFWC